MTTLMSACVVVVVAMVAAINLALPELAASSLRPSSTALLWIVDAYIIVFGCLLIPAGALADRLGRKGVLIAGLGTFTAGCLASAVAPSVPFLLGARGLTGLGAALVMPATLSLLMQVTPPERKPQAIATWSAATGAAGALGNLGGGLILQWLPWQGLFLTIGPLAGVLALLVARSAPRGERHAASLDPAGAALVTGSVFLLLLAIIEGPERGWTSSLVLGSAVGAALLFGTFVRHALRSDDPMLDPRIFLISRLRTGAVGVAAVFFGLFALFFVNAQYLQFAKGYSPLSTGIAILPLPLVMVIVSRRSVALASRIGVRTVVTGGLVLLAGGLAALSSSPPRPRICPTASPSSSWPPGWDSACRRCPPASSPRSRKRRQGLDRGSTALFEKSVPHWASPSSAQCSPAAFRIRCRLSCKGRDIRSSRPSVLPRSSALPSTTGPSPRSPTPWPQAFESSPSLCCWVRSQPPVGWQSPAAKNGGARRLTRHGQGRQSLAHQCDVARHLQGPNPQGFGLLSFLAGLVAAGGVEGEVPEELAGGGVDDADVEVVDEQDDGGAGVGAADADVGACVRLYIPYTAAYDDPGADPLLR